MIPNDLPIGIIGDGRVTTPRGSSVYPTGEISNVTMLAVIALATAEPLRALWIAPGSDLAAKAQHASFWEASDDLGPALTRDKWNVFATGPEDAPPDVAAVRRNGVSGAERREVMIYGSLDTRWYLDYGDAEMVARPNPYRIPDDPILYQHSYLLACIMQYEQQMGPARMTPASTALGKLEALHNDCSKIGYLDALSRDALTSIPWPRNRRPGHINQWVADGQWVHVYDKKSAYMASAMGEMGRGDPIHCDPGSTPPDMMTPMEAVKKEVPGLWCISARDFIDPDHLRGCPSPFGMRSREADHEWFYTPQVKLAIEMGYDIWFHEAYIWPKHHRTLRPWVQHIWQARQATRGTPVEAMIKNSFNMALGVMRRIPEPHQKVQWYHQPGWAGLITAQNYLRQVKRIMGLGAGYLGISTDSIAITSDDPDLQTACDLLPLPGTPERLGEYRHVTSFGGAQAQRLIEMARAGESEARVFGQMNAWGDEE